MKMVYILLVLIVAAAALGCVDKKGAEPSTKAPVPPAQTSVPPTSSSSDAVTDSDLSGMDNDFQQLDSLYNESSMEISLSEVNADAFT
jgi:hypothetical protein